MRYRILFAILLTACLLCLDTTSGLSIHCLTAPILTTLILSWPTKLLPYRIRLVVQFILGECFIVLCLVDCYCQEFFGTPITPQILTNTLLSDVRETNEFLSTFIGWYVLLHWRLALLLLLAVILPLFLFWKGEFSINLSRKYKIVEISICILCLIIEVPTAYKYFQLFLQKQNLEKIEGLIFRHYHEEIPTPLHRIVFAYYSSLQSGHVLDGIKRSTFSAEIDSCSYLSHHIVLVIGESYNKHHSSLYDYRLPTTPMQQERRNRGELFLFTNVVTPWNITSNVFLDFFSLWEQDYKDNVTIYPLFPILFRRAGYSVNFFSNQYLLKGFCKGATNQAGHFFLADYEMSDSLFTYRNKKHNKFDMRLVNQVADYKNHVQSSYTLDIIHLIGQHFDYSSRYPSANARFSLADYQDKNLTKEAKEIVMHYDNATFYNDMVLDSLISIYEREEAIILFIADHGEEVYDDMLVHGRLFQEPTASQARQEFEVPMWIWCSDDYRQSHPEILDGIEKALNKPFMTDAVPQLLLFLAGITCQWTDESSNLLSPKYQKRSRVIGGIVDYDTLH